MVDINTLVRKNVELEGLLKVLIDRNSIEARSLLAEKFREYSAMMEEFLGDGAKAATAKADAAVAAADAVLEQGHYIEVKDQEAVEAEANDDDAVPASLVTLEEEKKEAEEQPIAPLFVSTAADEPVDDAEPVTYTPPTPPEHNNERVLRAFTLNDRFRFCRELFGGNSEDFTDTINVIAQLPSFADAEDYLYTDLMWNREDPNVKDFMAILKENMA